MTYQKTKNEIEKMAQGGKILADVLSLVLSRTTPGISEIILEKIANEEILERGGEPAFKKVKGYSFATCISTNDKVVHGIPSDYKIKEGDVVGIDCGVYYKGFYTDAAQTLHVKSQILNLKTQKEKEIDKFLETGKKALDEAIKVAIIGNHVGNISKTIQNIVEGAGYSVVRSLVGHGVGRKLHEEPEVPGFLDEEINSTFPLLEGMTLAIEVIYNMGKPDVIYTGNDDWTIKTKDGSLSATFEKTIAITRQGPLIITK